MYVCRISSKFTSNDLNYVATTSFSVGTTIRDNLNNNLDTTLPALASAQALQNSNFVIDTTAPSIATSITLNTPSSSPGTDSRPSVDVDWVDAGPGTGTITLYSDSICSTAISDAVATSGGDPLRLK